MTSFYGSSFTNDYNSIKNTPIKNLKGTSESPIILSELSDGIYFFDGDYKISDADTALNRL
jgi:hypothetical protein